MINVDLTDMELMTTAPAAPIEIVQGEAMLSAEEARQIVKNINGHMEQSRKDLIELYDREGWRALGYSSWGACVKAEFDGSSTALYRQLAAAKIEREVFGDSRIGNPVPASQLEAVKDLPTEQKRAAFQRADELAGDQPRTAKHIQQAAAEIAAPDLPIDFAIVQRRLAAHGITLTHQLQYGAWMFVTHTDGKSVGIATPTWSNVTSKLESLEQKADKAPEAPATPSLAALDARIPADLLKAGYYWQSATPPTIRHNDGWSGDAPTVELALQLAYDQEKAKTIKDRRLPAPTYVKVMDLIGKLRQAVVDAEHPHAARLARAIAILIEQES